MSITAFMTLLGAVAMIASWAYIGQRIRHSITPISQQVLFLRSFFLYLGLFCVCLFLPQITLAINPSRFPLMMALGYIVGHILFYVGCIYTLRLTFSMIPRLADKQKYAVIFGSIALIGITALTTATMLFGTLPAYDYDKSITVFNVAPAVGASIGIFAMLSVFPAAILMIINGVRNPQARVRSFLLGGGLFVIMTAGPMHDVARSWELYLAADLLSIIGILILTTGIMYRLEERIVPAQSQPITAPAS